MNYWVRLRRMTGCERTVFEARCDILPDVAGYGDTAEEAYDAACIAMDALLPDLAAKIKAAETR